MRDWRRKSAEVNKLLGLLSLCRKTGKLRIGFEPVKEAVQAGEADLVLYAADFSPRSKGRMELVLEQSGGPPRVYQTGLTMFDLSQVCGKLAGVVAVADSGFAAGMEKLMTRDEGGAE